MRAGHPEDGDGRLGERARTLAVEELSRRCDRAGVDVQVLGRRGYPARLAADREAPAVLFSKGDLEVLDMRGPAVAVVGTRSASATGLMVARGIGRDLATAGVTVVSGAAAGIDSAALSGALEAGGAPSVAVLGTAHDARVPPGRRQLVDALERRGVVLSEQPPGSDSPRWRFATRNRLLAALVDLVVVVESHDRGGAFHTVAAARRRGMPVAVVPGSVGNAAAAGTNALLVAGARCVRHGADVLATLGRPEAGQEQLVLPGAGLTRTPARASAAAPVVDPDSARVLAVLGTDPTDLSTVVARAGLAFSDVALALERLGQRGLAASWRGWWYRASLSGEPKTADATAARTT